MKLSRREVLGALAVGPLVNVRAQHEAALERALRNAGGLPPVKRGGLVVLKVNTNSGDVAPYSTSPVVLGFLARHYVQQGVRVVAGDRSFWGDRDTKGNLERNGLAPEGRRAGAEVLAFEDDTVTWRALEPSAVPSWVAPVRVPELVFTADAVINLACAKTHFISGVTLGLKNALGFVHADDRRREGNLRVHVREKLERQVRELHAALPTHFTVIDAFDALVAGGPTPTSGDVAPVVKRVGVVLASRDAAEVETEARALLAAHRPGR